MGFSRIPDFVNNYLIIDFSSEVCDGGLNNTICTVFELQSGDDTTSQGNLITVSSALNSIFSIKEFHGIDLNVLHRALKLLEKQGKAEIISGSASDGSDAGVKFF